MSHSLQKMPPLFIDEASFELQTPYQSYKLPCILRSDCDAITLYHQETSLKKNLLSLSLPQTPVIVLIGRSLQASPQEQGEWVVFGQKHGFIFQWQNMHRAIEIFNLLCAEKRFCLAFLQG